MTTTHTFTNQRGERLSLRADFTQAASQIFARWNEEWFATPFQVADARHWPQKACEIVARWAKQ